MKRVFGVLLLLLPAFVFAQEDGWKRPSTIQVQFAEKTADQPTRLLMIAQQGNSIAIHTTQGVNGELDGVPRVELLTKQGVFTWIQGSPRTVLQLLLPTSFESLEYMGRPQFTRADLEFNLQGIEKALQRRVMVGKAETIADRNCLVLLVLDRPDSMGSDYQKLWIDRETGLTLKQEDYYGGELSYRRTAEYLKFEIDLPTETSIAEGALLIQGPVGASILQRISQPRPLSEFKTDIAEVNASKKAPSQNWAGSFDSANPFLYAQTNYRELVAAKPATTSTNRRQNSQRANQLGNMQQMMQNGNAQVQVTRNADGTRSFNVVTESNGQRQEYQITRGANGQIQMTQPGSNDSAQTIASPTDPTKPKMFFVTKSDFVDPKSGKTMSIVQVHGAPAEGYFGPLPLGTKEIVSDSRLSNAGIYSVEAPFSVKVLVWRKGEVRLALAANGMTDEQMISTAAKLK